MGSSLFAEVRRRSRAEGRAQGRSEGRTEGRTDNARKRMLSFAKQYHGALLPVVAPLIKACSDPALLQEWALAAPRLTDDAFLALVRSHASEELGRAPAPHGAPALRSAAEVGPRLPVERYTPRRIPFPRKVERS